jgi:predicted permease
MRLPARAGTFLQDLRYGARLLRRSPAFAATAVAVLSLGIGINTALFSIVHGLFSPSLHVRDAGQLFYIYGLAYGRPVPALDRAERSFFGEALDGVADFTAHWNIATDLAIDGDAETTNGEWVDANYFDLLGVDFELGRGLRPEDDDVSNPELSIVISDALWQRRFKADRSVIGARVRLDTRIYHVVGVTAPGFTGLSDPWRPSEYWVAATQAWHAANAYALRPIGRLRPGASLGVVRAIVTTRGRDWLAEAYSRSGAEWRRRYPRWAESRAFRVDRVLDVQIPRDPTASVVPRNVLVAIAAVVLLVLVIATANVAGLLLARGVSRTGEVAVRRALGAGGARLLRQFLTEALLLATAGGAAGAFVAWMLVRLFAAFTPPRFAVDVGVDARVLFFAVAVSIGSAALVGIGPALQARRVDVLEALGSGVVGGRRIRTGLRRWIVAPQVALSLVLLLVAGVELRALAGIESADRGYRTDRAVVLTVGRWEPGPGIQQSVYRTAAERRAANNAASAKARTFTRGILDRMREIPNVDAYGLATSLPLEGSPFGDRAVIDRRDYEAGESPRAHATPVAVSGGYFKAMGIRLLEGRAFGDGDLSDGRHVAIVSQALASRLMRDGASIIGQSIAFAPDTASDSGATIDWLEVVGVVNEVKPVIATTASEPFVYTPLAQQWRPAAANLVVRGRGDETAIVSSAKRAVAGADTFGEVRAVRSLAQMATDLLYPRRLAGGILAAAGLCGLGLACIGLYGVVAFAAAERLRELGIRATLGATRWHLLRVVLRDGFVVTLAGTTTGLVISELALRVAIGLTPDVSIDPLVVVLTPVLLSAVVIAAGLIPAWRVSRSDPAQVMRG